MTTPRQRIDTFPMVTRRAFITGAVASGAVLYLGGCTGWNDPTSWLDGTVPGPDDVAVVTGRIIVSADVDVAGIRIEPGGILQLNGSRSVTVNSTGNIVNKGRLILRPTSIDVTHRIQFHGVNEKAFVGGGMSVVNSDVGLWTVDAGVLDAQGTPRTAWNRTGSDPTWQSSDELVAAPNQPGDSTNFAPFVMGSAVPTVNGPHGQVATEVLNLSRNVWIEGTPQGRAHVMFAHCSNPQTIRHIGIRHVGPRQADGGFTDGVTGRYGLHFHHCGDGTRGTIVEGVLVRDGGHRGFVPHMSHGITFRDCIAHNVFDAGFWWDLEDVSHDIIFDRCVAAKILTDPDFRGYDCDGFTLGEGLGNKALGCVAVAVRGRKVNAGGFQWPSTANLGDNVWVFEDNVAHNNRDAGFSIWQNDHNPHIVTRPLSYHNGVGISHGAYINNYLIEDGVLFGNDVDLVQHSLRQTYERTTFGGDILITKHNLASDTPTRYLDCRFGGQIVVDESNNAGVIHFESTKRQNDLTKNHFDIRNRLSKIKVTNSDGSTFAFG